MICCRAKAWDLYAELHAHLELNVLYIFYFAMDVMRTGWSVCPSRERDPSSGFFPLSSPSKGRIFHSGVVLGQTSAASQRIPMRTLQQMGWRSSSAGTSYIRPDLNMKLTKQTSLKPLKIWQACIGVLPHGNVGKSCQCPLTGERKERKEPFPRWTWAGSLCLCLWCGLKALISSITGISLPKYAPFTLNSGCIWTWFVLNISKCDTHFIS